MVEGEEQCLRVAGEEKIEEHNRRDDTPQQNRKREVVVEL
jgi:hypothetical protein